MQRRHLGVGGAVMKLPRFRRSKKCRSEDEKCGAVPHRRRQFSIKGQSNSDTAEIHAYDRHLVANSDCTSPRENVHKNRINKIPTGVYWRISTVSNIRDSFIRPSNSDRAHGILPRTGHQHKARYFMQRSTSFSTCPHYAHSEQEMERSLMYQSINS